MTLTTEAKEDCHIIEEDPNESMRKQRRIYGDQSLQTSGTQTEMVRRKKEFKEETQDWAESQLFETLLNPTMQPYDQEQMLDLIIEQNIRDEDDMEQPHTLFYHYKKSRKIFSQIECEYHANILKKKLSRKDHIDEEHLFDIYYISLKTLGALMTLLMLNS